NTGDTERPVSLSNRGGRQAPPTESTRSTMSVSTRSRRANILGAVALVSASALVLAGCSNNGGGTEPEPGGDAFAFPIDCAAAAPASYSPTYESTSTGPASGLTYKIGTALPATGNLAFLGPP